MSDVAIRVAGLGKQYQIGGDRKPYKTIRESLTDTVLGPLRRLRAGLSADAVNGEQAFWALKDVSFEVNRGEVVGIIGRNGAGKSTLLKILSRITEPTEGEVEIAGRVGSLLEVGTGFHPELTGRENVYLNGAILGMKRSEIDRKFDEIVAFSEIEKFLETPVKHYSSGMYTRLAFAVAAHLEPEILVVDEVLAVGDAAFQKKCLGKMGDVAKAGRTVLFVSHNLAAVLALATRTVLFDQGRLTHVGTPSDAVQRYTETSDSLRTIPLAERVDRAGDRSVRMISLKIESGSAVGPIRCGDPLRITIAYTADRPLMRPAFLVGIYDSFERPIFFLDSSVAGGLPEILPSTGTVTCLTDPINLSPGPCVVNVAVIFGSAIADHVVHAATFHVEPQDFYGTGKLTDRQRALCLLQQQWNVRESAHPEVATILTTTNDRTERPCT